LTHTFADKLGRLFDECRAPDGKRYSHMQVVEAINATGQTKLSQSYLSELLAGKKDNPSIWTAKALADFFGQPVTYFTEPTAEPTSRSLQARAEVGNGSAATLADRINLLFRIAAESPNGEPTNAEVVRALAVNGHDTIDVQTLEAMRGGRDESVGTSTLIALARFFGVPAAILTEDGVAEMIAAQLPAMRLLHDDTVRRIAYRAHALSDGDRAIVASLLDRLAREDPGMSPEDLTF
jgi:transcriptional regulator with XRE-family HTH domain